MSRFGGFYETRYGPVRVSEDEGRMLELRHDIDLGDARYGPLEPQFFVKQFKARTDLLIADCEKVARHKLEHGCNA